MSLSGDKGVAQFKKSVKMGHPTIDLRWLFDDRCYMYIHLRWSCKIHPPVSTVFLIENSKPAVQTALGRPNGVSKTMSANVKEALSRSVHEDSTEKREYEKKVSDEK